MSGSGGHNSHAQYNCGLVYQQGDWYEVRIPLCSFMEKPVVVQPQEHHSSGTTNSGLSECDCQQTCLTQSGDPDKIVPSAEGVQPSLPALAFPRGGPLYNQIQLQASQV